MLKKIFLIISLLIICSSSANALQYNYNIRREIPLKFSYAPPKTDSTELRTPSIPGVDYFIDAYAYLAFGNSPFMLNVNAKLVIECDGRYVYYLHDAYNQVPCRAWVESDDDPSNYELSSNFGLGFGIRAEDTFFNETIFDKGLDFSIQIKRHGKLPLGNNFQGTDYLCGMDKLEAISLPIEELIPEKAEGFLKKVKEFYEAKEFSENASMMNIDTDFLSLSIAGEIVIEGKNIILSIDENQYYISGLRNKNLDPTSDPNVIRFFINIPDEDTLRYSTNYHSVLDPNTNLESIEINPSIQFQFDAYYTAGLILTLIPGLDLNIFPSLVSRGANPLEYTCPDRETLQNYYGKSLDNMLLSTNTTTSFSLPMTDKPYLPDISVFTMLVNDEEPEYAKTYVNEPVKISFKVKNIGERDTQYRIGDVYPRFGFALKIDGEYLTHPDSNPLNRIYWKFRGGTEWYDYYNNPDYPPIILHQNEEVQIDVPARIFTTPGMHTAEILVYYFEYKGTDSNGKKIFSIADINRPNNRLIKSFYVEYPRGSVIGNVRTNPCVGDCGVDVIKVCLKSVGVSGYYECVTSVYDGSFHGMYMFFHVPTGDYALEYWPAIPTQEELASGAPFYQPMFMYFHHNEDETTNFVNSGGGLFLTQFQKLIGKVVDANTKEAIPGVTVKIGDIGKSTITNEIGEFTFENITNRKDYKIVFSHPLYKTKVIEFRLFQEISNINTTHLYDLSYWDSDFGNQSSGSGFLIMIKDTQPPTLSVEIKYRNGKYLYKNYLDFIIMSYDNDKQTYQYKYQIFDTNYNEVYNIKYNNYVPNMENGSINIRYKCQFEDGLYYLKVTVKDAGNNETSTDYIQFIKDTRAPTFNIVLKDPETESTTLTNKKHVNVLINLTNPPETPDLTLYLSLDQNEWKLIKVFTGNNVSVNGFEIVKEDTFSGDKTVYAKIIDLAGNVSTNNSSITVNTLGNLVLANGNYYYNAHENIPILIDITPPNGVWKFGEFGAGGSQNIGDYNSSQYFAQKIVLSQSTTFNVIKFSCSKVGMPSDLHIKLIRNLVSTDPASNDTNNILYHWVLQYDIVDSMSFKYNGFLRLEMPETTLSAGIYYLLVYTDNVNTQNFYVTGTGYYSLFLQDYQNHMRYDYSPTEGWVEKKEAEYISTLTYEALYEPKGEVRIALDGNCNNESWVWTEHQPNQIRLINLQGNDGEKKICVRYRNVFNQSKDGDYYGIVFIDTKPPSGTASYEVDKINKKITFKFNASDTDSGIKYVKFYLSGSYPYLEYMTTLEINSKHYLYNDLLRINSLQIAFIDKAGNESPKIDITFAPEDDITDPTISISINDGNVYTSNTQINVKIDAWDNFTLSKIYIKEITSGQRWVIPETGELNGQTYSNIITLNLPQVLINNNNVVLEGTYKFEAYAVDSQGNRSQVSTAVITLDRIKPYVILCWLKGENGEDFANNINKIKLLVKLGVDLTPMYLRYRFLPDGSWSEPIRVYYGMNEIPIDGYTPLPSQYNLEIKIEDSANNFDMKQVSIKVNRPPYRPMIMTPYGNLFTNNPQFNISYNDPDNDYMGYAVLFVRRASDFQLVALNDYVDVLPYYFPENTFEYDVEYVVSGYVKDIYGANSPWATAITFTLKKPVLTITKIGTGLGKVESNDGLIRCDNINNDCSEVYISGRFITLTAEPFMGSVFKNWDGDCSSCGTNSICQVVLNNNKNCIAKFENASGKYLLTVLKDGDGSGTVTSIPQGISCGANCSSLFDYKTFVTLTAIPDTGTIFVRWDGDEDCLDGNVIMNDNKFCAALFNLIPQGNAGLTITKIGTGDGTISSSPTGIMCGTDCSEFYPIGSTITIKVNAVAKDSKFEGWSGDCNGFEDTIDLTLNTTKNCFANFRKVIKINDGANSTNSTKVTLTLDYSGASKMTIFNGKSWLPEEDFKNIKQITLPSGDGIKEVYVRILDSIDGLWREYKTSIFLDTKPPMGSLIINGGSPITNSLDVVLTISVVDLENYYDIEMRFSSDNSNWTSWESFKTTRYYTLLDGVGKKTIYVQFRDATGKVSKTTSASILYTIQ